MARAIVRMDVTGVAELRKSLEPEYLYGDAQTDLIEFGRREGMRRFDERAPRSSGSLAASGKSEMRPTARPPQAIIRFTQQAAADGFRYPYALNASKKFRRSATVSGGKRGARTYKWFTGIIALVRKAVRSRSGVADAKVKAQFARGGR